MNVLLAVGGSHFFRFLDGVTRRLCQGGHRVRVLHGGNRAETSDRALVCCAAECEGFEYTEGLGGYNGSLKRVLFPASGLLTYSLYLRENHPSPVLANRNLRFIPRRLRPFTRRQPVRRVLASDSARSALRQIVRFTPPDRGVVRTLEEEKADVLVATPFVYHPMAQEIEFVRAARALGIPAIVAVASWDNLTTKGAFPVVPDLTLLWNEPLAQEATELHGIPPDKIGICGALPFDYWFDMRPSGDRGAFCRRVGLDPQRPFVAYLCSSGLAGPPEDTLVRELMRALGTDAGTRDIQVLVRPHPFYASIWEDFEEPNATLWPPGGELPDVEGARQDYYDSLFFSSGAVGLNTSAFLEAAIIDRPCISIISDAYQRDQGGRGHFRHLAHAGFLEFAHGVGDAVRRVRRMVNGADDRAAERRAFVRSFIRPLGLDTPAREVAAQMVIDSARRRA
ncbi:MAG: hypothetical protein ACREON_04250 [Gemmatimonadaceae bacterium]